MPPNQPYPAGAAGDGRSEQPGPPAGELQQPRDQPDLGEAEGEQPVLPLPGLLHHRPHRLHLGLGLPHRHRLGVQVVGRRARHPAAHQVRQPSCVTSSFSQPTQVIEAMPLFRYKKETLSIYQELNFDVGLCSYFEKASYLLFSKQMLFWVGCKVRAVEQVIQKILLFDLPIGNPPQPAPSTSQQAVSDV